MKWFKHGVVWKPDGSRPWARSHASGPTPVMLDEDRLRVYVQCRDEHNVGRVGFVDLDPRDPRRVLAASDDPVLDVGQPGTFDDNGVFQASILKLPDGQLFMYYVGFELCHHVRYRLLTGLAVSDDGGESFQRFKATPILERSDRELHFRCGPFVLHEDGRFRMWYVAGSEWERIDGKAMPLYDIRYLESPDGRSWPDHGRVVMPVTQHNEHGFGRPYVIHDGDGYRMYYSIRKRCPAAYRLAFATSTDGLGWQRRDDEIGIEVSAADHENESVEYAAEFTHAGRTWLLYNGNDFGRTGLCLAERLPG